ncbi:MAG: selenide, water dikinase SelD, partial [Devosiaceae bacterium]|nr:selenide, water dikinase SelD [Devosiaceae bacterium]
IVQTVDFFAPIVNDPYHFGQIAAANAISDIYAMGATPIFALNVVGFPEKKLPQEVLKQILKGASDKAAEAGIEILGGHTVKDDEPKFGMTVTGTIHPNKIMNNSGAKLGDALILTKPLGSGIITTGIKKGMVSEDLEKRAIAVMSELNKTAAEIMKEFPVNACTDVTGFGLLGHLVEMTRASEKRVQLELNALPVLDGALEMIEAGIFSSLQEQNIRLRRAIKNADESGKHKHYPLLFDPQTSGGLLAAIPAVIAYNKFSDDANKLVGRLEGFADEFSTILSRQLDARGGDA